MYVQIKALFSFVHLLQGILDTYRFALGKIELHGPTNFSSILDKAISYAEHAVSQKEQHYYFLLIITVRKEQLNKSQQLFVIPFLV